MAQEVQGAWQAAAEGIQAAGQAIVNRAAETVVAVGGGILAVLGAIPGVGALAEAAQSALQRGKNPMDEGHSTQVTAAPTGPAKMPSTAQGESTGIPPHVKNLVMTHPTPTFNVNDFSIQDLGTNAQHGLSVAAAPPAQGRGAVRGA